MHLVLRRISGDLRTARLYVGGSIQKMLVCYQDLNYMAGFGCKHVLNTRLPVASLTPFVFTSPPNLILSLQSTFPQTQYMLVTFSGAALCCLRQSGRLQSGSPHVCFPWEHFNIQVLGPQWHLGSLRGAVCGSSHSASVPFRAANGLAVCGKCGRWLLLEESQVAWHLVRQAPVWPQGTTDLG